MLTRKLITGIATAGLFVSAFAPAAFAADATVQGTGAFSYNDVTLNTSNVNVVNQKSTTEAVTVVGVNQNTGGNSASFNTGNGGTVVWSGDTTSTVATVVTGGDNTATLPTPCGCQGTTTATVKNTGAFSVNKVKVNNTNTNVVSQTAKTEAFTGVSVNQKTGYNTASFNTGGGLKTVKSGNATSTVTTFVTGGSNSL